MWYQFILRVVAFSVSVTFLIFSHFEYRNSERSQTTLEAETDEARSRDLKMHVTVNKEINSIEKPNTNLKSSRTTKKMKDVKI